MNQVWTALVGLGLGSAIFGPAVVVWWRSRSRSAPRTVWLAWSSQVPGATRPVKSVAVATVLRSRRRGWLVTVTVGERQQVSDPRAWSMIVPISGTITVYGWTERAALRRATDRCRDDSLWRRG